MTDLWVVVVFTAFFGTITALLGLTYVAFIRMDKAVRRARMFIMDKRIERFLGAFTLGFIALTGAIIVPSVGVVIPAIIGTVVLVVWLGAMGYGTLELFFIVRPPRGALFRLTQGLVGRSHSVQGDSARMAEGSGSERDAAK